ncbi:MAG TPA: cation:proton antiporter [Gemmatimonadales bacterium]|nr:cation:proton antiporter [Gemmatimonadales bacterium]
MLPTDLLYVALLFVLFVVPRYLQRFRLPSAITSLFIGVGAAWLGVLEHDRTVELLSTFGIVALFLFAGLDVDLEELRPDLRPLLQYLAIWAATLGGVAWVVVRATGLPTPTALLVALGLVTPSTGFILDSLDRFGLGPEERRWVKSKAIAVEILALLVLFGVLQSSSWRQFGESSAILVGLIVLLPPLFRWFAERIAPHAPKSEFAFLLMIAVLAATVTRRLGVYYLVGAFVVGLAARQFRRRLPAMSSEGMLQAVEAFASFFVPFYFFHAGQGVDATALDLSALLVGLLCLAGTVTLRLGGTALHRWWALREPPARSLRIGVALLPTLVFTLVLAGILRERPEVPRSIVNGMVIFTVLVTLIPGMILRLPPVEYELARLDPVSDAWEGREEGGSAT